MTIATGQGLGETVGNCGGQDQSSDLPVVALTGNSVNLDLPAGRNISGHAHRSTGRQSSDRRRPVGHLLHLPTGMTAETVDPTQCTLVTEGFDFGFQGDAGTELHLADASGRRRHLHLGRPADCARCTSGPSFSPIAYAYPDGYGSLGISTDGGDDCRSTPVVMSSPRITSPSCSLCTSSPADQPKKNNSLDIHEWRNRARSSVRAMKMSLQAAGTIKRHRRKPGRRNMAVQEHR